MISQELLGGRVLLKYEKGQGKLLTETSEGTGCPASESKQGSCIYFFQLVIKVNQKNVSRLQRSYQTHSHNIHLKITELEGSQGETHPQAVYIVVT